jgi:siroheme synthase
VIEALAYEKIGLLIVAGVFLADEVYDFCKIEVLHRGVNKEVA